jgi:hypothetical protein
MFKLVKEGGRGAHLRAGVTGSHPCPSKCRAASFLDLSVVFQITADQYAVTPRNFVDYELPRLAFLELTASYGRNWVTGPVRRRVDRVSL